MELVALREDSGGKGRAREGVREIGGIRERYNGIRYGFI